MIVALESVMTYSGYSTTETAMQPHNKTTHELLREASFSNDPLTQELGRRLQGVLNGDGDCAKKDPAQIDFYFGHEYIAQ